jgi:flavin reductase (DIM6/NTAB) family NADH-FMN oxidoreductase RutF
MGLSRASIHTPTFPVSHEWPPEPAILQPTEFEDLVMPSAPFPPRSPESLQQIDRLLRQVDREIWIVTAAHDGLRGGLTATWVSQASIDPQSPLVLIGLAPNHHTAQLIRHSNHFGLHLLRASQVEVAWNFARDSSQDRDKFLEAPARTSSRGIPLLMDCLGWLECRVLQRVSVADRWHFWADVLEGELCEPHRDDESILTERRFFGGLDEERRRRLVARRDADIAIQRPWIDTWRRQLSMMKSPPPSPS